MRHATELSYSVEEGACLALTLSFLFALCPVPLPATEYSCLTSHAPAAISQPRSHPPPIFPPAETPILFPPSHQLCRPVLPRIFFFHPHTHAQTRTPLLSCAARRTTTTVRTNWEAPILFVIISHCLSGPLRFSLCCCCCCCCCCCATLANDVSLCVFPLYTSPTPQPSAVMAP